MISSRKHVILTNFLAILLTSQSIYTYHAPTQTYSNTLTLSPTYTLYWTYNSQNITFEIHVQNSKCVLFGIQGPTYSDVIIAAIFNDTTGHFSERTLTNNKLSINPNPKWTLLNSSTTSLNYSLFTFYRSIKVQCPTSQSLDINPGTTTLVFSSGTYFNQSDNSVSLAQLNTTQMNLLNNSPVGTQFPCLVAAPTPVFNSTPTGYYQNYIDLVPGIYRLYYNVTATKFTGEVHCETSGWVGFGFSQNGAMIGADVVVGFIDSSGKVNFTERFITARSVQGVQISKNQTAQLLAAGKVNNYTYFKFTRYLINCASQELYVCIFFVLNDIELKYMFFFIV